MDRGTLERFEVVSWMDPALAMSMLEVQVYAFERDPKLLKVKAGQLPTKYVIRPLTKKQRLWCDEAQGERARFVRAFMAGVHEIIDVPGYTMAVRGTDQYIMPDGSRVTTWSEADLESDAIPDGDTLYEIGGVAYAHSVFRRAAKRQYPLLRLSQSEWELAALCRAESTPTSAEPTLNSAGPSPSLEAKSSAPTYAELTGAPATDVAT